MRIFLIIDETHFYQPDSIADLIRNSDDEFIGAALVTKVMPKSNLELYLKKHWYFLRFSEMSKLGTKKIYYYLKDKLRKFLRSSNFYSVKTVFDNFSIDYFEVEYNINKPTYLDIIRSKKPDVIVSSNSLIFGSELLEIPRYCSINRHSALLPSYGGLWPVFQAVRSGEKQVGVSVHTMEKKIDRGILLAQKAIPITNFDTIDTLYQKCFKISASVILEALRKIKNRNMEPIINSQTTSYFSFPKKEHWAELRKRKRKFI